MLGERRRLAARMLCAGFTPDNRCVVDELIDEGLGAVILFGRNIAGGPAEVAALVADLKRRAGGRPLLVCIDHEGGRVMRMREGFSPVPSMRDLGRAIGRTGDLSLAREVGRIIGRELRAVGIDVNFAPVMDVDTNPNNPVIGDRSLGDEPCIVGEAGGQIVRGMQESGVAACLKHFPGHGDTSVDSHYDLPRVMHNPERLNRVELRPFRAGIEAGAACVMTAHVLVPALDAERPATMSRPILTKLLRERLGFGGVVVSDDFEMKALADFFPFDESVIAGAEAGLDVLCVCHNPASQRRALALLTERVDEERLRGSAERLDRLCARFCRPAESAGSAADLSGVGSEAHRATLARLVESGAPGPDPTEAWRS